MNYPIEVLINIPDLLLKNLFSSAFLFVIIVVPIVVLTVGLWLISWYKLKKELAKTQFELLEKSEILKYTQLENQKIVLNANTIANSKREIIAQINHDIRNPINAMWGMANLLNNTNLTHEQRILTNNIRKSGEELLRVSNEIVLLDVLQYSNIETNKQVLHKTFSVREVVEEVINAFALKGLNPNVDLHYFIDNSIPDYVIGDSYRIRQILMNLVENALHHTHQGAVCIKAFTGETVSNAQRLEFEVIDNGIGMEFEKLKRLSQDLALDDVNGTADSPIGLSLTVCKKLIQSMNGFIEVDSQENTGTTFRFNILTEKTNLTNHNNNDIDLINFINRKVLIINENEHSATYLSDILQNHGLQCQKLFSTQQLIGYLNQHQDNVDLLLIDEKMLASDEAELISIIHQKYNHMPIMLLADKKYDITAWQERVFKSFITKPLLHSKLLEQIAKIWSCDKDLKATPLKLSKDFAEKNPLDILIAEDDQLNREMMLLVLHSLGYQPEVVKNGKEVLEIISHQTFDVILMDIQMPELDGLETTRMIRLCIENQPTIIAMTANSLNGDKEECLNSGMNDYISKPLDINILVDVLEKWYSLRQDIQGIRMTA